MATHSSILAWEIPWTEEPCKLQSMGSQRVRQDRVTFTFTSLSIPLAPPGAITVAEAKPLVYVEKNLRDLPIYLVWENPRSDQIILITILALLSITVTCGSGVLLPGLCHQGTPSFLGSQDVISKEESRCFSMWDVLLLLFWLKHFSVLTIHRPPSTNPHPQLYRKLPVISLLRRKLILLYVHHTRVKMN